MLSLPLALGEMPGFRSHCEVVHARCGTHTAGHVVTIARQRWSTSITRSTWSITASANQHRNRAGLFDIVVPYGDRMPSVKVRLQIRARDIFLARSLRGGLRVCVMFLHPRVQATRRAPGIWRAVQNDDAHPRIDTALANSRNACYTPPSKRSELANPAGQRGTEMDLVVIRARTHRPSQARRCVLAFNRFPRQLAASSRNS